MKKSCREKTAHLADETLGSDNQGMLQAQPPSVRKGMPNGVAQPHIPNGTHRPHRQLSAPATPAHHDTPMEQAETWPSKRRHINGHGDVGSGAGCTGPMSVFNDAHGQAAARGDAAAPPSSGNHPPGTAGQPTQNGDQPPQGHPRTAWSFPVGQANGHCPNGRPRGGPSDTGHVTSQLEKFLGRSPLDGEPRGRDPTVPGGHAKAPTANHKQVSEPGASGTAPNGSADHA